MQRRKQKRWQMTLMERAPALPAWTSIPESCRRELIDLLTQLLLQHSETDGVEIVLANAEADDE